MTSDDSREVDQSGSNGLTITANPTPFSNLAFTVEQVNRTLELGNPVSCWSRQAAYVLMQSPVHSGPSLIPEPVQRGVLEALNPSNLPQTMVGTILQMSLLFEQLVEALLDGHNPRQIELLVARYRKVAEANGVSIPWYKVMNGRVIHADILTRLDTLLNGSTASSSS